jgi:molybdate transport system permease protein
VIRAAVGGLAAVLVLFLGLPLVGLFVRLTPAQVLAALATPAARGAIALSAGTTLVSLALTIMFGTPLAFALARGEFRGRRLVDALVDLPIVVPPAVAGLALLVVFGRYGLLGPSLRALGIELSFTTAAVVLAQVFVASPFYVRAARSGFSAVDRTLEAASATLGMGPLRTFAFITVPLAGPALLGGAILCWARALGEFGATIMFAGNLSGVSQTLPLLVYLQLESGNIAIATAVSVFMIVVSVTTILLVRRFEIA